MILRVAFLVSAWFFFNFSLGNLMKWIYMYGEVCSGDTCRLYEFPFFITAIHMAISSVVGLFTVTSQTSPRRHVILLAFLFAVSVGTGNGSLVSIYPSFKEMITTMTPFATMLFVVTCTDANYNLWAYVALLIMCGGLVFCAKEEVNFSWVGVLLSLAATLSRGAKTVLQGVVLEKHKVSSTTLVSHMAPWCTFFSVALSLTYEGLTPITTLLRAESGASTTVALVLLSSVNAYLLNLSNFQVTSVVGPLSLQVFGILKSALAILGSSLVFGNIVTPTQVAGICVCLGGIVLYQQKGVKIAKIKAS